MSFRVKLQRRARRDVDFILEYIAERSRPGATAWAKAFDKALERLSQSADTFPLAEESELVDFDVQEVLFKTRRGLVYRALFTIKSTTAHVLHVRGPGQDYLTEEEIEPPG